MKKFIGSDNNVKFQNILHKLCEVENLHFQGFSDDEDLYFLVRAGGENSGSTFS